MKAFDGSHLPANARHWARKNREVTEIVEILRREARRRLAPWMDKRRRAPQGQIDRVQAWFGAQVRKHVHGYYLRHGMVAMNDGYPLPRGHTIIALTTESKRYTELAFPNGRYER